MAEIIYQTFCLMLILGISGFVLVVGMIVCFHFPRRCEKCGKLWAFKTIKRDVSMIYTAGGYINSNRRISYKICVSCGFESKPKLESMREYVT